MNTWEQRLRRNFLIVAVVHVGLIGGLVLCEGLLSRMRPAAADAAPAYVVADLLGDLPKGPGVGRGAYAPPRAAPPSPSPAHDASSGGEPAGGPSEPAFTPEESAAPAPRAHAAPVPPAHDPNDIYVGKKAPDRLAKKSAVVAKTSTGASAKTVKVAAKSGAGSPHAEAGHGTHPGAQGPTGEGASDIRNRFAKALAAAEGGTPYGDGRPGGGGNGSSKVIGSPNGSPNGEVGGVGKGTPFWWYFEQVHDKMYQAWEQPGQAVNWDKRLMTTLMIRVARDGKIVEVWVKDPSGNKIMDDSALAAARRVMRLEPLPDGLGGETADISVAFQLES